MPTCQARLDAGHEIPDVDKAATSWRAVSPGGPAAGERRLSDYTQLRESADFCPFAKWETEALREEVASPGDPDRKELSKASCQDPRTGPLRLCALLPHYVAFLPNSLHFQIWEVGVLR